MKLSLNFVKDYIDLPQDLTVKQIAEDIHTIYKNDPAEVSEMIHVADPRQIQAAEKLIPEYVSDILERGLDVSKAVLTEKSLMKKI